MSISPVHAILAQAQQVGDDIVAELQQAAGVPIEAGVDERSLQQRLEELDVPLKNAEDAANVAEVRRLAEQAKGLVAAERMKFERALEDAQKAFNDVISAQGENSAEAAEAAEVAQRARQGLADFDTYKSDVDEYYDSVIASAGAVPESVPLPTHEEKAAPSGEDLADFAQRLDELKREFYEEFERIRSMTPTSAEGPSDAERQQKAAALLEKLKKDLV